LREEFVEAAKMPSSTAFLMMAGERVDKQGLTSFGRKTFGRHTRFGLRSNHYVVKNLFGLFSLLFSAFGIIHKSYRQVLTPDNNLKSLLSLPMIDKFRLVTFHLQATQKTVQ
jgi:hypothetical protein